MNIPILYEDNQIIVCEKPVGVLVQSDRSMDYDMVNYFKNYLHESERSRNPNNGEVSEPYIGLIHRLDRPVGGVMVFAKTQKAAKILSEQVQAGSVVKPKQTKMVKKYLAVVDADLSKELGVEEYTVIDYLAKDARTNLARISSQNDRNAKRAELSYRVLEVRIDEQDKPISLVEVSLKTGRHHQIRAQMANQGTPLWGDTKYNQAYAGGIEHSRKEWIELGLFAYQLTFMHPISSKELSFKALPSTSIFKRFSCVTQKCEI